MQSYSTAVRALTPSVPMAVLVTSVVHGFARTNTSDFDMLSHSFAIGMSEASDAVYAAPDDHCQRSLFSYRMSYVAHEV